MAVQLKIEESLYQLPSSLIGKEQVGFYFDCNYDASRSEIIADIERYWDIYVIGFEVSKKNEVPHAHVVAWGEPNTYANFRATILAKKLALSGRAKKKGDRRQYGKINHIKCIHKLISYTIKNKNFTYKGVGKKYIDWRCSEGYVKSGKREKFEEILDYIIFRKIELKEINTYISVEEYRRTLCQDIIEKYQLIYGLLPSRNQMMLLLYRSQVMTSAEYVSMVVPYNWLNPQ